MITTETEKDKTFMYLSNMLNKIKKEEDFEQLKDLQDKYNTVYYNYVTDSWTSDAVIGEVAFAVKTGVNLSTTIGRFSKYGKEYFKDVWNLKTERGRFNRVRDGKWSLDSLTKQEKELFVQKYIIDKIEGNTVSELSLAEDEKYILRDLLDNYDKNSNFTKAKTLYNLEYVYLLSELDEEKFIKLLEKELSIEFFESDIFGKRNYSYKHSKVNIFLNKSRKYLLSNQKLKGICIDFILKKLKDSENQNFNLLGSSGEFSRQLISLIDKELIININISKLDDFKKLSSVIMRSLSKNKNIKININITSADILMKLKDRLDSIKNFDSFTISPILKKTLEKYISLNNEIYYNLPESEYTKGMDEFLNFLEQKISINKIENILDNKYSDITGFVK